MKVSFVTARAHVCFLVHQRFLVQYRFFATALVFPGGDVGEMLVVAFGFALLGLEFLAEMAAARFIALQGIDAEQFGKFHEVRHATGVLQLLIELAVPARDSDVGPEFVAQRGELKAAPPVGAVLNHHFNAVTSWGVDGTGELKHVYA